LFERCSARTFCELISVRRNDLPGPLTYWPDQFDNPDAHPADRYIAEHYANGIPITVVSDSLTPDDTGPWRDQTTIVPRADAHQAVAELRERDGDALMFGSQTLWTDLLSHGLVDELHLMLGAKIVARERHAFVGVPEADLQLIGVRTWAPIGQRGAQLCNARVVRRVRDCRWQIPRSHYASPVGAGSYVRGPEGIIVELTEIE
jgi:dihydrofolate reductase